MILLVPTDAERGKHYWLFRNDATNMQLVECVLRGDRLVLRNIDGRMTIFRELDGLSDFSMYEIVKPETMQYDLIKAKRWIEPAADFDDTPSKLHF